MLSAALRCIRFLTRIWARLGNVTAETPLILTISIPFRETFGGKNMSRCKYFTDEETTGLVPDICFKLDRAREFFAAPIVMTCGYRSPEHNTEIGGVPGSAHTKGMAVDVRAPSDPFMRIKLAWAFGCAGFKRLEIAPHHYHVDVDPDKPSPCVWEGDDK